MEFTIVDSINIFMEELLNTTPLIIQDSACLPETTEVRADGTDYSLPIQKTTPNVDAESIVLAVVILVYGAITMLGSMFAIHKGVSPSYVMRTIALLSVINASVLLVITGISEAAIAPIVGLFGTIIGYIVNRHPSGPNS